MNSKPAPQPRGEASRIRPVAIVSDTQRRLSQLSNFAQAAVRHGAHQTATDEQLIAWIFGYQLRGLNLTFDGSLMDVHDEIDRRESLAKQAELQGDSSIRFRRRQHMVFGHVLTSRGVEVGIIDRMSRRASSVGVFLLRLHLFEGLERARVIRAASDQLLIDVRFWVHFIADNAGGPSRGALGVELWSDIGVLRQEVNDRIEEMHDPELNPEALYGGRVVGAHTPVPRRPDDVAVMDYRLTHNLPDDHPFWTDERILIALHIGME